MEYYSGGKCFIIHAHNNIDEPQEVYARFKKKKKNRPKKIHTIYKKFWKNQNESVMIESRSVD